MAFAFKDGFDRYTYLSVYEANDSYIDDVTLPDSTLLTVTDDGIIDVQMEYPVNVTQIYKDVELISLKKYRADHQGGDYGKS